MDNCAEKNAAVAEFQALARKAFSLSDAERMAICDMGFFNDTIRGYLITAMRSAGFSRKEIIRALEGLRDTFDVMTAAEAAAVGL